MKPRGSINDSVHGESYLSCAYAHLSYAVSLVQNVPKHATGTLYTLDGTRETKRSPN